MAYLIKQQVIDIIQKAPEGTTPEGIVAGLRQQGHQLEGYTETPQEQILEQPQQKKTTIEKVGDFLGLGPLGKGMGLAAFKYLTPEGRELEKKVNEGTAREEELREYGKIFGQAPTTKQVLGSALQTMATIGTAGIGAGAILPTAGKVGAMGGIAGFGRGLEKEKSFQESAKEGFTTGLTSFAVAGTFGLVAKGVHKILEKTPEKLYNSALKVNEKIIQQGKSPSKVLIEDGTFGGLGKIYKESQGGINEMEKQIADKLAIKKSVGNINTGKILNEVKIKMIQKYGKAFSNAEIEAIVDSIPANTLRVNKSISYATANQLRQELDKMVSGKFGAEVLRGSLREKAIYHTTNILRNKIQQITGTQQQFAKLSAYIKANQLAEKAIAHADKYWGVGFKDLVLGGLPGFATGGPIGGAVGYLGSRFVRSPAFETSAAVLLDRIQKIPTDSAGKISRMAIMNLIKEITANSEK